MTESSAPPSAAALKYLRERARLAHLDGNGVLVNHLAAIALHEARKPRSAGTPALPVGSWAWSVVFSLFWLSDSYMLFEVEKTLKETGADTESDRALVNVLRAYEWLVKQPLDPNCEKQKITLKEATFEWVDQEAVVEHGILFTHTLELLWFRNARGTDWVEIGQRFAAHVSPQLAHQIRSLIRRLQVQTSFAILGAPRLETLDTDSEWDVAPWVPQLWQCMFDSDFAGLEKILATESPRHSATTPAARFLFDMRHFNRWHGKNFGDPQAIGLTRRRIITTQSPELVFHSVREERVRALLVELHLDGGGASDRFFASTLAMLLEVAALRRWDLSAWCTAVELQARLNAEVVARDRTDLLFVDRAIRCAVSAFRFDDKHKWIEPVLARLEFLHPEALSALLRDLLRARPVQYRHVKRVLEKIGDAVPPELYSEVAEWSVHFVDHATHFDPLSIGIEKIEFLGPLLDELPEDHPAWRILWQVIEPLFETTFMWEVSRGLLLHRVLTGAPLDLAKKGIELMLGKAVEGHDIAARWDLIHDAVVERSALGTALASQIIGSASSPEDLITLQDQAWAAPHLNVDQAAVRKKALVHLEKILEKAVPTGTEFSLGVWSWDPIFFVRWSEDDLNTVRQIVEAIDHPRVLSSHIPLLLAYLRSMVEKGPAAFADLIAPSLCRWLKAPPTGTDPMARHSGLFSVMVYRSNYHPQIVGRLVHLAAELRTRLGDGLDAELIDHLTRIAAQPPTGVTGAGMRLGLDLVTDNPDRRVELLSACQALLLAAQLRATANSTVNEELMDGLRYPTWFVSLHRERLAPQEIVCELAQKLEALVIAVAKTDAPRVRGQVAAFIASLKARNALTPGLEEVRLLLERDPRASVRRLVTSG